MQKILISLFFIIFISTSTFGQVCDPLCISGLNSLKAGESQIGLFGSYFISSNSINGSFVKAIYNGDYLDNNLKKSVTLVGDNVFGSASDLSFSYAFKKDNDSIVNSAVYYLGVSDKRFSDLSFNNDYYNLLFYGNSNLPIATLDGFSFNFLNYQKLFAGIYKSVPLNKMNLNLYGGIALLKGQKFYSLTINEGNVNTSEYGEEISLMMDYNYLSSDTSKFGYTDWNGTGLSTDIFIEIANKNRSSIFSVGIFDYGKIYWNSNSQEVNADTTFTYNGLEISNLVDFTFNNFSELGEDSLLNELYYSKSSSKNISLQLPARMYIGYYQHFPSIKTGISLGAQYILYSNMTDPYIFIRSNTRITNSISGLLQVSHGGYTGLQVGLGIQKQFNNIHIHLFSSNISGFFPSENTFSQQANISAFYKF